MKALVDFRRNVARRFMGSRTAADIISKYSSAQLQQNQAAIAQATRPVVASPAPNGAPTPAPNGGLESVVKQPDLKAMLQETAKLTAAGVRL
jgi:hypothetical protein